MLSFHFRSKIKANTPLLPHCRRQAQARVHLEVLLSPLQDVNRNKFDEIFNFLFFLVAPNVANICSSPNLPSLGPIRLSSFAPVSRKLQVYPSFTVESLPIALCRVDLSDPVVYGCSLFCSLDGGSAFFCSVRFITGGQSLPRQTLCILSDTVQGASKS